MRKYRSGDVVFQIPKSFTLNSVEEFLKEFEVVFTWKNRSIPKVELNFKNLQKINLIGLLLIYKVIDFVSSTACSQKFNSTSDKHVKTFVTILSLPP